MEIRFSFKTTYNFDFFGQMRMTKENKEAD